MMNSQSNVVSAPTGTGSHGATLGASVRLLARRPSAEASAPKGVTADGLLVQPFNLSRTQLNRKFAATEATGSEAMGSEALGSEATGSLGRSGTRGKSKLWVTGEFWRGRHIAQAVKLAIIDAAFVTCYEGVRRRAVEDALSA